MSRANLENFGTNRDFRFWAYNCSPMPALLESSLNTSLMMESITPSLPDCFLFLSERCLLEWHYSHCGASRTRIGKR